MKGRINYVNILGDLHSHDANYHLKCRQYFMNDRYIPTIFSGVSKKCGRPKSMSRHDSLSPDTKRAGRPSNIEQEEAFMKVIEGMSDKSDTQQFLLVDLVK